MLNLFVDEVNFHGHVGHGRGCRQRPHWGRGTGPRPLQGTRTQSPEGHRGKGSSSTYNNHGTGPYSYVVVAPNGGLVDRLFFAKQTLMGGSNERKEGERHLNRRTLRRLFLLVTD